MSKLKKRSILPESSNVETVPGFWRKLMGDSESIPDVVDVSSPLVLQVMSLLEENEDYGSVDLLDVDVYRFELESYGNFLKSKIRESKENLDQSSKISVANYEFLLAKYSFFEVVILDEFCSVYRVYSALLKNHFKSDEDVLKISECEKKLKDLYEMVLQKDSETMDMVRKLVNKAYDLLHDNEELKGSLSEASKSNVMLLQDISTLEKVANSESFEISSDDSEIVLEEAEDFLIADEQSQKILVEQLKSQVQGLQLQLALFDQGSKVNARDLADFKRRAEEGDRAVKRLRCEMDNIGQSLIDNQRLQSQYVALVDQLDLLSEEKEALTEQLHESEEKMKSLVSINGIDNAGLDLENLELKSKLKKLEYELAERNNHIKVLTAQVASLENMYKTNLPQMIKELSYKISAVASGVDEIKGQIKGAETPSDYLEAVE